MQTASVRRLRAEVLDAVDRVNGELLHVDTLQHAQRNVGARRAAAPHFAVELGLRAHAIAADAEDDVAHLDPGLLTGAVGRHARDHETTRHFVGRDTEPRPWRSRTATGTNEVRKDGFKR